MEYETSTAIKTETCLRRPRRSLGSDQFCLVLLATYFGSHLLPSFDSLSQRDGIIRTALVAVVFAPSLDSFINITLSAHVHGGTGSFDLSRV